MIQTKHSTFACIKCIMASVLHCAVFNIFVVLSVACVCCGYTSSLNSNIKFDPISTNTGQQEAPLVNTSYGPVQGLYLDNDVAAFLGVRFALPPVGSMRWQPPQMPHKWDMYHAVTQPPGCPQICTDPPDICAYYYLEDCLYLNIYTPPNTNGSSNLPVMMFFHGGNFRSGGASAALYDGRFLSLLTNTVVVASNYRLGALGFMSTTGSTSNPGLTGNYGFLDQQAALKFVNQNIAAFGGNPKKVTLFGQSAGAQSISLHLTNPESAPYFQQAIMESGPFTLPYRTPVNSRFLGDLASSILKCDSQDLKCLLSRTAEDIVAVETSVGEKLLPDVFGPLHLFEPWGPVIDGKIIKENPLNAYRDGKFQKKPMLIGSLAEEGRVYIWSAFSSKPTKLELDAFLTVIFGVEDAYHIYKEYNFTDFDDLREPLSTVATDYVFMCPAINGSRSISSLNMSQVYHYIFDHAVSFQKVWGPNYTECYGHVCHGSELPFVFRTVSLRNYTFTEEELKLAESFTYYWGNFAHTGNPNNEDLRRRGRKPMRTFLKWPSYEKISGWKSMFFQSEGNGIKSNYRDIFCQYFNTIGYTPN